jgi:CheY-like chemotaxis protein
MKRFLEKEGFTIAVALNGIQALEIVKTLRPAAIVLDVLMPGIDGWGVLAALKNDADIADIPVIILSIVEDRNRGFLLGANEYVTKPVDWERLAELLRKYRTNGGGGSILVVDDDAHWRELCRRALEQNGWRVVEAADGDAGLHRLAEHQPCLILLDLMLPGMDGFEFLEQVRKNPQWQGITIVVMTAKEIKEEDRRRLNGRVQEILEKGRRSLDDLLEDILRGVKRCAPPALRPDNKESRHAQDLAGRR